MTFDVALFDVDGTLVDSNDQHARAWVEAFREHGHHVEYETVRRLIGKGGDKIVPELSGKDPEGSEGKAIGETRTKIFSEKYLPTLTPFSGGRALLLEMKRRGYRIGVASSAKTEELEALLRLAHVDDLIETSASGDEGGDSKPDPDIVVAALHRMNAAPEDAVLIGDTPYDIEAAVHAGVAAVAVTSGGWRPDALRRALAVYSDVKDLCERLSQSPLAR